MRTLAVEIPDQLYEAFEHMAARRGRSVEAIARELLTKTAPRRLPKSTPKRRRAGLARLMRFAGCVSSGDPHSADNERIDADLAREYANDHKDEPSCSGEALRMP